MKIIVIIMEKKRKEASFGWSWVVECWLDPWKFIDLILIREHKPLPVLRGNLIIISQQERPLQQTRLLLWIQNKVFVVGLYRRRVAVLVLRVARHIQVNARLQRMLPPVNRVRIHRMDWFHCSKRAWSSYWHLAVAILIVHTEYCVRPGIA